jgi:hypothetical protein
MTGTTPVGTTPVGTTPVESSPLDRSPSEAPPAEALIEEARRRRRRRHLRYAAATGVLVAALTVGLLLALGSGGTPGPANVGAAGHQASVTTVRTVGAPGTFIPEQLVAGSGKVWVLGSTRAGCGIEEVDPATLRTRTYRLPACALYAAAGDGHIYLTADESTTSTDTTLFRIESFDVATGRAVVMSPVDTTTTGTGYAHMALTYGEGSLWLSPWADEILQISPATGAVIRAVAAPVSGGGHPVLVAGRSGLWLAGGPGGSPVVYRLAPGARTVSPIYTGSAPGSILGLSMIGDRVWANVGRVRDGGRRIVTRLVAFDASGHAVLDAAPAHLGDSAPVGSGAALWFAGSGATCDGSGAQRLWRVDGRTARALGSVTLHPTVAACLAVGGSSMAAVGGDVFVLDPTGPAAQGATLYRITS